MAEMLTGCRVFLVFPCTALMSKEQGQIAHLVSLALWRNVAPWDRKSAGLVCGASWELTSIYCIWHKLMLYY